MQKISQILKYLIGLAVVLALRLLPHPPNVEPIMSTMMPFAKKWGWLAGAGFTLIAILGYDVITGTLGVWSLSTAGTYMFLGILAGLWFKNRESTTKNYVIFAIFGTLVYDAITGIVFGVILFDMPFWLAFTGQIPFTAYHLAGNIVLAALVSPALYKWIITNPKLELGFILNKFKKTN